MIVVVEPHADDAFLSLHGHLWRWRREEEATRIVTVYGNARRMREAAEYAKAVGAEHVAIGVPETGLGNAVEWEAEPLPDFTDAIEGDTFVWPLGLKHPEHRAVVALARPGDWHYVEQPYAGVMANEPEVNRLLAGRSIVSWHRPHGRKRNAAAIFRSQSMFMHRNLDRALGAPEVIVQ